MHPDIPSEHLPNADPKNYQAIARQHRAWAVLRALYRQPSYRSNASVLCDWVDQLGLGVAHRQLSNELQTLQRQLIITTQVVGETEVVELTAHGAEYLEGRLAIDGLTNLPIDCPY